MFNLSFPTWASMLDVQLTPHAFCLAWDPVLLSMTIFGNALTSIAYLIIPLQLAWLFYTVKTQSLVLTKSRPLLFLFAAFILCCGISHQLDIVVLWFPWYWIQSAWMCLTGSISILTALCMPYLLITSNLIQEEKK